MIRYWLAAFLVITSLSASAHFISWSDYGRLKAFLKHMEGLEDRAQRALDDQAPDELRYALIDLRKDVAAQAPLYARFRGQIKHQTDALYAANAHIPSTESWPVDQERKRAAYLAEASDITAAQETNDTLRHMLDHQIGLLQSAHNRGEDPLAGPLVTMYQGNVAELWAQIKKYHGQVVRLGDYLQ
ncbi:MAG: hypothetical protein ACYCW6_17735 [Candidatus Xenobia bacterium]